MADNKVDENNNSKIQTEDDTIERINEFVTSDDAGKNIKDAIEKEPLAHEEKEEEMTGKSGSITQAKEEKIEQKKEKPKQARKPEVKKPHVIAAKKPVQKSSNIQKVIPQKREQPQQAKKVEAKKTVKNYAVKKPVKKIILKKPAPKIVKNNGDDKMSKKKHSKSNQKLWIWIGVAVLAVILIVALVFIAGPKNNKIPAAGTGSNQTSSSVAATVNGDPIYLQDITTEYNNLNPSVKGLYSIESLLNKSIDETLMVQESKALGIKVTPEEIQNEIDAIKTQNGLTDDTLAQALQQQGMDMTKLKALIEKNLQIRALLNSTILSNITVTATEVENYYNLNIENFKIPAKVTVEHILVATSANRTDNQSKEIILQVQKELNDTNFCNLVVKYSDDLGSKETCGQYTFGKGEMVPEFETASFALNVNDTTIVKTIFGWHLIKKLADMPAHTSNLSDVYSQINTTIYNQIAQKNFDALVAELKSKAIIVNYVAKTNSNETTVTTLPSNFDDFAKCLTSKGAVFYGASWCPKCQEEKASFGSSMQYINYVECADATNPKVQTAVCTKAGITGYPTWIVNGQSYPGEAIEDLAKLTGCTLPQ